MNIVSKVTWMYMKKNRKRTLVTIFGVIISVAMITAVLVSIDSFMDMFRQREIAISGSWIAEYQNINSAQLEQLKNNEKIATVMLRGELGYSELGETNNSNKKYLYVEAADANAMADMRLVVNEGRLPEKSGEIVISSELLSDMGEVYSLGDTIELELGHRELEMDDGSVRILDQTANYQGDDEYGESFVYDHRSASYTIVGFIGTPAEVYPWAAGYSAFTFLDIDLWPSDEPFNVRAVIDPVDIGVYKTAADISETIGNPDYRLHESLLTYYGVTADNGMNLFLRAIGGFLIGIIMVGSVMLIYNAFAISLSERSRQLGMLSSVGATRAQKRRSVFFEGAVIGAVSIPLGLLAGIGGMTVTFKVIDPMVSKIIGEDTAIRCVARPLTVIVAVVLAMVTILISSWIPAIRAARITPIDSIRQSRDIKLTRRQVKTSRLTRLLFGFEGELALKNLKRNKKSYRVTIISLILSFVLFISVAGYVSMLQKGYGMADDTSDYDVYVYCSSDNEGGAELVTSLKEAEEYNVITRSYLEAYFNDTDFNSFVTSDYRRILEDSGMNRLGVSFRGMTKEKLSQFMESNGMDPSVLDRYGSPDGDRAEAGDGSQPIPVVFINGYTMVTGSYEWSDISVADVPVGQSLSMDLDVYDDQGDQVTIGDAMELYVAGVTDQLPMGLSESFYPGMNIYVLTLDTCLEELVSYVTDAFGDEYEYIDDSIQTFIYLKSSDPEALTRAVQDVADSHRAQINGYYSAWETEQSDRALMTMLQIFCYGFIALMTLICTANILNTVSTGIDLRRREFAMLKSVGMAPRAFNRMLVFESLFYGIKTLLYGIPLGIAVIVWEYRMMREQFYFKFFLPVNYLIAAVIVLVIVVAVSMAYAFGRVRRENILDGLRTE